MRQEIWICLVQVAATRYCLDAEMKGAGGAYTTAIIPARDRRAAKARLADSLESLGYRLMALQDLETFRSRARNRQPSDEIRQLARKVRRTGELRFDAFYLWLEGAEDEEDELPEDWQVASGRSLQEVWDNHEDADYDELS